MAEVRKWTKQQEVAIRTLTAQQDRCEQELNHALEEYEALSARASNFDPNTLWPERLKEREALTNEVRATLQTRFGSDYSEKRLNFAEQQIREMLPEEERELRRYRKEARTRAAKNRNQAKETAR